MLKNILYIVLVVLAVLALADQLEEKTGFRYVESFFLAVLSVALVIVVTITLASIF